MKYPLLLSSLLLTACSFGLRDARPQTIALFSPDMEGIEVIVEVADDNEERRNGLMGRESLEPGHGMIFLFEEEGVLTFWMKNTLIPLDVIFFDGQGRYISHTTMQPCEADPCPYYGSLQASQLALEVPAGFAAEHGVGEGWRIALPVSED